MGNLLQRRLRVPESRITHIDNGLDLPSRSPFDRPVRRLAFVGMLTKAKGVADLLEALAGLAAQVPDLRLTVIGDGSERANLERRAMRDDLAGRVEFLGFREDVPRLLATADALVLPSRMEQQPLVVIEAMAAAEPVLITNVGGCAEMVDGVLPAELIVQPRDVHGLRGGLKYLIGLERPGDLGRDLALRAHMRFGIETAVRAHMRLYVELMHE